MDQKSLVRWLCLAVLLGGFVGCAQPDAGLKPYVTGTFIRWPRQLLKVPGKWPGRRWTFFR